MTDRDKILDEQAALNEAFLVINDSIAMTFPLLIVKRPLANGELANAWKQPKESRYSGAAGMLEVAVVLIERARREAMVGAQL